MPNNSSHSAQNSSAPSHVAPKEIFGWAMFDFANSAYTTVIVTLVFSVYFTKAVVPEAYSEYRDLIWGMALTLSTVFIMVGAPILGAIADHGGRKKRFLFASYVICVLGTAALYFVTPGRMVLGIFLFVLSNLPSQCINGV